MLNWFHKLMPREDRFFTLFDQHAQTIAAGARAIRSMLEGGAAVQEHCREIMRIEHEADEITREVMLAIRSTFITPFDRGDIKDLITAMDNSVDQMEQTAKTIILFRLDRFEPEMQEMGTAIVTCADLVRKAVPLLSSMSRNAGPINELCVQITKVEGHGDDLYDRGMKALFDGGTPEAMPFIIRSQIYEHLENAIDNFDDIGNQIQGIVIEHV